MARALKIRRVGLGVGTERVIPFRGWLDAQPRSELTYPKKFRFKNISTEGTGWTTEDFFLEAHARGCDVKMMTTYKWCSGSQPRYMTLNALRATFPTIKF